MTTEILSPPRRESRWMHAVSLTRFAATFVEHSAALIALDGLPPRELAHSYWLANRFRHEAWSQRLSTHRREIQKESIAARNRRWNDILPVMQEILLSEPLARCIAYHAKVAEERGILGDFASLAHSALMTHVEARHRCLHLMVFGKGLPAGIAESLNGLRRALEEYSDRLIALMPSSPALEVYCFDKTTVFRTQLELNNGQLGDTARRLFTQSSANWLDCHAQGLDERVASPRLNHRLLQTVLDLLPAGVFDGYGQVKRRRAAMFEATSADSSGMLHDLSQNLMPPLNILLTHHRPASSTATTKDVGERWTQE